MSDESKAMSEWVKAVSRELGLEAAVESDATVDLVLDLTSDVAHGVSRPAAPVTAFLVGLAAGRAADPAVAARDFAQKIGSLADGWGSEADDQQARG
ncbi:DUF6457 domain-containing protein [Pseudonocardia hispaniensis]|uniref:DUF6457 domain-containing protein n=1 Tax=Pseudonocardia hispaniensis TaxID=904933 RepID=A0ABW1J7E2_9PSEU